MDRIYLCVQNKNNSNFNCTLHKSFIEAVYNYINKKNNANSTMINIYKYIPITLNKYILKYKISDIFCNIKLE